MLSLFANCQIIAEAVEYGILNNLATSPIECLGLVKSSVDPKYTETNSRLISGPWLTYILLMGLNCLVFLGILTGFVVKIL